MIILVREGYPMSARQRAAYMDRLKGLLPADGLIVQGSLVHSDGFHISTPHLVKTLEALRDEFDVLSVTIDLDK